MSAPVSLKTSIDDATEALWTLAESGDVSQLWQVIACGAEINSRNSDGVTPLMRAIYNGHAPMVSGLIAHGADLNAARADGFTPLLLAAFFGHADVVRILVEAGADLSSTTRCGTSAQMWATSRSFFDIADYLKTVSNDAAQLNETTESSQVEVAEDQPVSHPFSMEEWMSEELEVAPTPVNDDAVYEPVISEHVEEDVIWNSPAFKEKSEELSTEDRVEDDSWFDGQFPAKDERHSPEDRINDHVGWFSAQPLVGNVEQPANNEDEAVRLSEEPLAADNEQRTEDASEDRFELLSEELLVTSDEPRTEEIEDEGEWRSAESSAQSDEHPKEADDEETVVTPQVLRTLKDPPEIWDLVHENRVEFKPAGAFITRITSVGTNFLLLVLTVILVAGAGTYAFLKFRDGSSSGATTKVEQVRPKPDTKTPVRTEEKLSAATAPPATSGNTATTEKASTQLNPQPNEIQAERVGNDGSKNPVAIVPNESNAKAESRVARNSESRTVNEEGKSAATTTKPPKTQVAPAVRTDAESAAGGSDPVKQPAPAKQAPPTTAPAAAPAPKPKVIQWP